VRNKHFLKDQSKDGKDHSPRFRRSKTGQLGSIDPSSAEFPFSSTAMMPMKKYWHHLLQE